MTDTYDTATYYDAQDSEELHHEDPEEAIVAYFEWAMDQGADVHAVIAKRAPVTVTGYARKALDPKWARRMATRIAEDVSEQFSDEYGGRDDGEGGFDEEALDAFEREVARMLGALVEKHGHIRQCSKCGERTYSAAEVEAILREAEPGDRAMDAAQIGVAQCAQVQDALRRVLPMAEAWFRREFGGLCDHEPGECHCDRKEHARTDINIALAALGKGAT